MHMNEHVQGIIHVCLLLSWKRKIPAFLSSAGRLSSFFDLFAVKLDSQWLRIVLCLHETIT